MGIDGVGGPKVGSPAAPMEPAKVEAPAPKPPPSAPSVTSKISEGFDAFKKKLMSTTGKYSAHQVSAPDRPDLSNDVSAVRSAINAGGAANFVGVKFNNAQAEREMPPVGKNQQVSLADKDMRNQMLRGAPQVNEVSKKAGNGGDICAGAAMSSAVIMTSDTPEKAAANAKAVRDLANDVTKNDDPKTKPFIKPEEEAALKRMEGGTMSSTDAMHMQQLMYRLEGRMPSMTLNPEGKGRSPGQVGSMAAMLKQRGGLPGPEDVTFHQNGTRDAAGNLGNDHWTVTVGRTHVNSDARGNKSTVTGGPPPELARSNPDWRSDISVYNSDPPVKVVTGFKTNPTDKGYHEFEADPSKLGAWEEGAALKFEDQMRRAAAQPEKPID